MNTDFHKPLVIGILDEMEKFEDIGYWK